jgi:hypothetical protein
MAAKFLTQSNLFDAGKRAAMTHRVLTATSACALAWRCTQ